MLSFIFHLPTSIIFIIARVLGGSPVPKHYKHLFRFGFDPFFWCLAGIVVAAYYG